MVFISKLFEDAIIAYGVGICKSTFGCILAKFEMMRLRCLSLHCKKTTIPLYVSLVMIKFKTVDSTDLYNDLIFNIFSKDFYGFADTNGGMLLYLKRQEI